MRPFACLALLLIPSLAQAEDEVCVVNGTNDRYYFTIETRSGTVESGTVIASGKLCADASASTKGGRIEVSESKESVEGCTRLTPANSHETLLRFAIGDLCTWSSQPRGRRF